METRRVTPLAPFEGYPDGVTRTKFVAGEAVPVPAAYAAVLEEKGLVAKPAPAASRKALSAPDAEPQPETAAASSRRKRLGGGGLSGPSSITIPDQKELPDHDHED